MEAHIPAPRKQEDPAFVRALFSRIARRYDVTNSLLSGGLDHHWRRILAGWVQGRRPGRILDLATGSGVLAERLARSVPGASIVGADFCLPMLREAWRGRGQRALVVADGLNLPFADASFDLVTIAFGLRNMASWPRALSEMRRVLRPGGGVAVLDFSLPQGLLRAPYRWYLHRVLPRLAGFVTREPAGYVYLGESIENFPSGDAMKGLLTQAGFIQATARSLTGGIVSLYTALTPEVMAATTPSN